MITGPSGSGKSSLAFDTLYAEGQRRYVESLSAYARQFLEQMEKPDVESVTGLSPGHRHRAAHDGQPSALHRRARSPRSTTTCACSSPPSAGPTAPGASEPIAAQTRRADRRAAAAQLPRGRRSRSWPRWCAGARGPSARRSPALAAGATCAPASTARARNLGGAPRPRPAPQPPDRRARRPPGPARRGARSACARASRRPCDLARRRGARLRRGRARSGCYSRRLACVRCDVSVPELSPARLLLQQPLRRLPGLRRPRAALGRGRRRGSSPTRRKIAPRRGHPSLAAPRARASCARRSRRWPQRHGFSLEVPVRELPRKARAGRCSRVTATASRASLPDLRATRRGAAAARPVARRGGRRRPRDGGEAFEDLRPYLVGGALPRRAAARACGRRAWPCAWAAAPWPSSSASRSPTRGRPLAGLAFSERERPVADRLAAGDRQPARVPRRRRASAT